VTFLKSIGILSVALIIQSTLVHWEFLRNMHPDLIIITLVYLALKKGPIVGVFSGFTIGLIQDVYAIETLGVNALCKSTLGYFMGLFDESRFTFTPTTKLIFLGGAFFLHDILFNISIGLPSESFFSSFYKESLPAGVFTIIIGAIVFYFFKPKS
jgi:rod shape-determining protein MreD